jgi:hypothetical protein
VKLIQNQNIEAALFFQPKSLQGRTFVLILGRKPGTRNIFHIRAKPLKSFYFQLNQTPEANASLLSL